MPLVFVLFSGLLLKHFLADFVFQPRWMLAGKGRLSAPGGYVHAAVHALGSGLVLAACGIAGPVIAAVAVGEFAVHYGIDFAKDRIGEHSRAERSPRLYWQLHGLDQLAHQITYVAITYMATASLA
ncbi:DUF3307 domain-containing protein [Oricola thermophila]|uniref:DUF3307 domain-containing protein n=1 Tax=Oricola thermophila TaxID=2742145 RepID=A0A6N1VES1_9HYPH|nr:DUF3307 domain-containing protein [Oricola thermophila]QKV19451.1 DUF3307 domain-containing protein [Oricola thermophila]